MKHFFLFTISPVQSFIQQARKTHDLYAGSRILSKLTDKAMELVQTNSETCEFIFPTIAQESKPNRFIALVTISKRQDMQKFSVGIQEGVKKYLLEGEKLGKEVIKLLPSAKIQLEDFLKIYWVAQPYKEETEESYLSQIRQLEQNLAAVKNIRHFEQFSEKGRKCSLNGEYNVKFYRLLDGEQPNDRLFEKKLFQKRRTVKVVASDDFTEITQKDLNQGEGLCAISMLKRLFLSDNLTFPSTAGIALMDTLKRNSLAKMYLDTIQALNKGYVDEQIYYESNTTTEYFKKHGYISLLEKGNTKIFRREFNRMKNSIKSKKLKLSKYYAILAFDADGMGQKLQKCLGQEDHRRVSEHLANFAKAAKEYIDDGKYGQTVYAGGDDFLGFINLNYLFDVLKDLRIEFDLTVNAHLREELKMTFSAGVAIGHYKTPLSEVLSWAKKMEKTAKDVLHNKHEGIKKDAISLAVLKRSGEIHYTTWRWRGYEDCWTTDLFKRLVMHLREDHISKKFITNLSSEYEKRLDKKGNWGEKANEYSKELNKMLAVELDFFITKATASNRKARTAIDGLTQSLANHYLHHINFDLSVQNFLNMLHICEFIVSEINPIESENITQNFALQNETV